MALWKEEQFLLLFNILRQSMHKCLTILLLVRLFFFLLLFIRWIFWYYRLILCQSFRFRLYLFYWFWGFLFRRFFFLNLTFVRILRFAVRIYFNSVTFFARTTFLLFITLLFWFFITVTFLIKFSLASLCCSLSFLYSFHLALLTFFFFFNLFL